MEHAVAVAAAS